MTCERIIMLGMVRLAENFDQKLTDEKIKIWFEKFRDWPGNKVKFAIEKIIDTRTEKTFPVIADMFKAAEDWDETKVYKYKYAKDENSPCGEDKQHLKLLKPNDSDNENA